MPTNKKTARITDKEKARLRKETRIDADFKSLNNDPRAFVNRLVRAAMRSERKGRGK